MALFSDSIIGLQIQLNILYNCANNLGVSVNLDKSNIVIFRNGGYISSNEGWFYGNQKLEIVNMYKYLGIYLSTRLSFIHTMNDLADRAKRGVFAITKLLWSVGEHSSAVFFKLFDCQIQPILVCGSEVWGLTDNQEIIERIHLFAIKKFLGVNVKAPRHLIYGETGRYPLYVNAQI